MTQQIHIANGTRVQTLAVREGADGGLMLFSTLGSELNLALCELYIPAAARPWLARMARPAPIVPTVEARRAEANGDG